MLGFGFRLRPGRRQVAGFSLLEILVAFTLLAMALGILMQIFSRGVNGAQLSDQYAKAAMLGESKLAAVGIEGSLAEGETSGKFDDDFAWNLSVSAYIDPTPDPATAGIDVDSMMSVRLYNVALTVSFIAGDTRPRNVTLTTLQLGPKPS